MPAMVALASPTRKLVATAFLFRHWRLAAATNEAPSGPGWSDQPTEFDYRFMSVNDYGLEVSESQGS